MLQNLCMPALIYLIYSITHVIIDMYKEEYSKAMIEFWISVMFTLLLNILCQRGLGIVSWLIVSIPFILMTTIATLLMYAFDTNPATGQPLETDTKTETETETETKPSAYAYPIVAQYKDTHPASYDSKDKYTAVPQCQTQQTQTPTQQTQTQQTQQTTQQTQQTQQLASISYQIY